MSKKKMVVYEAFSQELPFGGVVARTVARGAAAEQVAISARSDGECSHAAQSMTNLDCATVSSRSCEHFWDGRRGSPRHSLSRDNPSFLLRSRRAQNSLRRPTLSSFCKMGTSPPVCCMVRVPRPRATKLLSTLTLRKGLFTSNQVRDRIAHGCELATHVHVSVVSRCTKDLKNARLEVPVALVAGVRPPNAGCQSGECLCGLLLDSLVHHMAVCASVGLPVRIAERFGPDLPGMRKKHVAPTEWSEIWTLWKWRNAD